MDNDSMIYTRFGWSSDQPYICEENDFMTYRVWNSTGRTIIGLEILRDDTEPMLRKLPLWITVV